MGWLLSLTGLQLDLVLLSSRSSSSISLSNSRRAADEIRVSEELKAINLANLLTKSWQIPATLRDLFEPSSADKSRVQVWIDSGLLAWEPELSHRIERAFASVPEIELVRDVQALPGGEAVKNDPTVINDLLRAFDEDGLDRRSYVTVIGGGAILDAVGYAASIAQ